MTQPMDDLMQPVAEVQPKMTGGNVGIATVIHEIYSPLIHPLVPGDKLYTADQMREYAKKAVGLAKRPEQEPVGSISITQHGSRRKVENSFDDSLLDLPAGEYKLYTTPQPAQPEQEPVAWSPIKTSSEGREAVRKFFVQTLKRHDFNRYISEDLATDFACVLGGYLAYTTPPAQRQPLTDERIDVVVSLHCKKASSHLDAARVARPIEAAHGIKEQP